MNTPVYTLYSTKLDTGKRRGRTVKVKGEERCMIEERESVR